MIEAMLDDAQKRLRSEVREFVKSIPRQMLLDMDAEKIRYPHEYLHEAAARGLLGLRFPKEYGGRELGWRDEVIALEEIGALPLSLGCLYSLVSICGEALNVFGTEEQKRKYLEPTIHGKMCCAEALTEPRGGSDFFGATTVAHKDGDSYILNGQKRFVVGAEGADYFLVYAKTSQDGPSHQSLSMFIVEKDMGVQVKHVYGLMGTRGGGAGRILFRDVQVPARNIVGREGQGAEIFYQMMIPERMTSAAGVLGIARSALEIAARYSERRKAFGRRIRDFQAVSFKVADSLTRFDAASSLVHTTAVAIDRGGDANLSRRLVSEAKKFATQAAWEIVNDAMQILGGIGYTNVYPIERMLRDTRLAMIWTGTNEVMNLIIQHEYYRDVLSRPKDVRDVEADAPEALVEDEKVFE
ncbi:MAG TPA: acyl-CoA dehydrogenase family protein [Candidatus Brocadiia bacterium]|nr:acyl-CoA dehydrogenase family protein [Candidatus Brocadiia bacterium]